MNKDERSGKTNDERQQKCREKPQKTFSESERERGRESERGIKTVMSYCYRDLLTKCPNDLEESVEVIPLECTLGHAQEILDALCGGAHVQTVVDDLPGHPRHPLIVAVDSSAQMRRP